MHPGHKLGPNHRTKPEPIMKITIRAEPDWIPLSRHSVPRQISRRVKYSIKISSRADMIINSKLNTYPGLLLVASVLLTAREVCAASLTADSWTRRFPTLKEKPIYVQPKSNSRKN